MNREIFFEYITNEYGIEPEYLFEGDFVTAICRHRLTKKWFALFMRIPYSKLGLDKDAYVDVMNVKVASYLNLSIPGYFPAWHMNKQLWTTVLLDGTVPEEEVKNMIDLSFAATDKKNNSKIKIQPHK